MATPMSARRSAGASLTPSPVMATTWSSARSASAIRSLASGELRAKISSRPSRSSRSSSASLMRSSSSPVTIVGSSRAMPTCRAIAAAVRPWSPVTTMIRIPAAWHAATASATSGRGGSSIATSPRKQRSRSACSRSSGTGALRVEPALRDAEHAQALVGVVASTRSTSARSAAPSGRSAPSCPDDRRAARQQRLGRALGVHPQPRRRARRRSTSASATGRSGTGACAAARASRRPRRPRAPPRPPASRSRLGPRAAPSGCALLHAAIACERVRCTPAIRRRQPMAPRVERLRRASRSR